MIPSWLSEKLAAVPDAGEGVHGWLFSCARQLHAHMDSAAVEAVLSASVAKCGRRVPGSEIRDAVRNSAAVAWRPKGVEIRGGGVGHSSARDDAPDTAASDSGSLTWPKIDPAARAARIADAKADGVASLAELWELSPVRESLSVDDWLDVLFPGGAWLCLAVDHPATARSRKREKWTFGAADNCGLIVPSPMSGPSGKGLDGRITHRCLDNTGPRRWLIVEFDSGTLDEQAALHWHLAAQTSVAGWPRLALVVWSGKKSLHGWYGPCNDEEAARDLMAYARTLGADTATWNRCQLVRLPGGRRVVAASQPTHLPDGWDAPSDFVSQSVFYFHPTPCSQRILHLNSTVLTAPLDSSHLHALTAAG